MTPRARCMELYALRLLESLSFIWPYSSVWSISVFEPNLILIVIELLWFNSAEQMRAFSSGARANVRDNVLPSEALLSLSNSPVGSFQKRAILSIRLLLGSCEFFSVSIVFVFCRQRYFFCHSSWRFRWFDTAKLMAFSAVYNKNNMKNSSIKFGTILHAVDIIRKWLITV